jgi:hypothetical protein
MSMKTLNTRRNTSMMISNKFKFAAMAVAIVGSTSSVLAASVSQTSDPARGEQRRSYTQNTPANDARANVQTKQNRYVAPLAPSEPFTAAEKRKFQTPTGREVDTW